MAHTTVPYSVRTPLTRRDLWLGGLLLVAVLAALLWHLKRTSVEAHAAEWHAVLLSPIAEHYARRDHRQALPARLLLSGFGELGWYAQANRSLPTGASGRVVLYGDSITEFWPLVGAHEFFPGRHYIDRGIRGQATPELLWRFRQDVLDLHPATLVLLGGANDILLRGRHLQLPETERNLQAMVEAAQQQHIRVILCLLTPIFTGYPDHHRKLTREIRELNTWILGYAKQKDLTVVDYFDAMAAPDGTIRPGLTLDGIHPNDAGYALMLPLAQKAIDETK